MEYLSQYEHHIIYIRGEDNTVADALLRLPDSVDDVPISPVAALLTVETDNSLLKSIIAGYEDDPFCRKLKDVEASIEGVA